MNIHKMLHSNQAVSAALVGSISLLITSSASQRNVPTRTPYQLTKLTTGDQILIAQQYGGTDPHGYDPHGSDPHDENHDFGLKANAEDAKRQATSDVYGGRAPGVNSQHPLDNLPGQPGF